MTTLDLIGIGSPLVDLLLNVDDDFLVTHVQGAKGGMELVGPAEIETLLGKTKKAAVRAAGGAASNTTVGCANLGLKTAFVGSIGKDAYAEFYREALVAQACEPRLIEHGELPTGHVLSMVTPDSQRTMRTCLAAAAALDPAAITAETFRGAKLVVLEGYTLFNHDLTRAIARAAREAGCELALDLASFEVVYANKAVLDELLTSGQVDLVFANEDEAKAWNAEGPEAALADLARHATVAVVKLGKEGALIRSGETTVRVPAELVEAVDTTGAGDCWAAGFLAGYLRGLPLEVCGTLGAKAGAAVVQVMGAQVPREAWLPIKGYLDAFV